MTHARSASVGIGFLSDHLDTVPAIARSLWREWGYTSVGRCAAELDASRSDALPIGYVAVTGRDPVGVVGLIDCNLPTRCDLHPWLAGLFVWPEHRRNGIGTRLVRSLEAHAADLGFRRLYLYTESAESFYLRLGWETIERDRWEGEAIAIMTTEVPPPTD